MADFAVTGADEFFAVSKALKAAGQGDLRKALNKGMRDGAKPLLPKAKAAAARQVPSRGGLAAQVAREPMRVQVRTGAATAGVRVVVGRRKGAARSTNAGTIRHPVFGRARYVTQQVPGARGWFDDTLAREAPSVRPDLERVVQEMVEKIVRSA